MWYARESDLQEYSGWDKMAKIGAINANDPPCTIGSLKNTYNYVCTCMHNIHAFMHTLIHIDACMYTYKHLCIRAFKQL